MSSQNNIIIIIIIIIIMPGWNDKIDLECSAL